MNLDYTIVRSARRSKLTITVERDSRVIVHAPENVSEEKIHQVVNSRRQWIYEKTHHSQKYAEPLHPPGKELVNGESAMYLGRNYQISIADTASGEIEFSRKFLIPPDCTKKGKNALASWYLRRAEKKILPRVAYFSRQLGVEFTSASITDTRFRWGSCTAKNNLSFNWRLIKAPMSVIDYVVVHELAHLIEANHTPRFWNIVKAQVVTADSSQLWLKEHGDLLEQSL